MTPLLSHINIFLLLTPELLNKFAQAWADAPAPLMTTFTSEIFFLEISKAFIKAALSKIVSENISEKAVNDSFDSSWNQFTKNSK